MKHATPEDFDTVWDIFQQNDPNDPNSYFEALICLL